MPGIYRHPPQPWQLPPHVIAPPDISSQTPVASRRNVPAGGSISTNIIGLYPIPSRRKINQGAITTASFTLFIAGISRHYQINTLNITQPISQAATGSLDVWDDPTSVHFDPGQEILMYQDGLRVFGGTLDDVTEAWKAQTKGTLSLVKFSDFSNVLDRHIITKYYGDTQASLQIMVADIVNTDLSQDGIVYDASDSFGGLPSIVVGPQLFTPQTIRQAFNTISNLFKWDFNIDYYKVLRWFPRQTGRGVAPFNIADGDTNILEDAYAIAPGCTSLSIRKYRGPYRNRQYVTSSTAGSAQWQDIFSVAKPGPFPGSPQPPDGTRFFFVTLYGLISKPVVTVNGVAQRVVAFTDFPLPSGSWDWYWIPQQGAPNPSPGVGQNLVNPRLTSADTLIVNYATNIPPVTFVDCPAQINARAAIEGNSGIYADVQPANSITDPAAITAFAQGLLDRYGCTDGLPTQVMYSTRRAGVFAGMVQTIQRTHPLIASAVRQISNVSIHDKDGQFLVYQITADSGRFQGNANDFFAQIQQAVNLPQPMNRMTYIWDIYPSVQGLTNPGGTGGTNPTVRTIANPLEILQLLIVGLASVPTNDVDVQIVIDGNTTGSFTVPAGTGAPQTFYYTSGTKYHAGASMQVNINPHGTIKDVTVQLVTSVVVSA